ncbi:hypothetical protein VB773_03005 [Haloarculaceae archaeon H-GB2-1]|nr:hypothetical protein [Haloarculaceae archaeon H-GB2-1]
MDDAARVSRRGVLALVGATALSGCRALDGSADDGRGTVSSYDLPRIEGDDDSYPDPIVAPGVPVAIAESHITSARDRTMDLLAELPTPLGAARIPNGHVRQRLTDAAADATTELSEARTATTEFEALRELRYAREHARYAAAGWAFVEDGVSVDQVRAERRQTRAEARSVREDHEYIGDDPVRAAVVHASVEALLEDAAVRDSVHVSHGDPESLLAVAEWGEAAESAKAHLADARHLDDQFTASLPADVGTIEETLRAAGRQLLADVRTRRSALPPEPTDDDWEPADELLMDLRREATDGPLGVGDATGPASAVVGAMGRLATFRALDRVRKRIDDGETFRVEDAANVHTARRPRSRPSETHSPTVPRRRSPGPSSPTPLVWSRVRTGNSREPRGRSTSRASTTSARSTCRRRPSHGRRPPRPVRRSRRCDEREQRANC